MTSRAGRHDENTTRASAIQPRPAVMPGMKNGVISERQIGAAEPGAGAAENDRQSADLEDRVAERMAETWLSPTARSTRPGRLRYRKQSR